jgi:hypothetical protein
MPLTAQNYPLRINPRLSLKLDSFDSRQVQQRVPVYTVTKFRIALNIENFLTR